MILWCLPAKFAVSVLLTNINETSRTTLKTEADPTNTCFKSVKMGYLGGSIGEASALG